MTKIESTTLDGCVWDLTKQGFTVVHRSETEAQLTKPKTFSAFWALAWFLVFGIGIVVYLIHYAAKKDKHAYIVQHADGSVTMSRHDGFWGHWERHIGEVVEKDEATKKAGWNGFLWGEPADPSEGGTSLTKLPAKIASAASSEKGQRFLWGKPVDPDHN